jgi:tetratricopeptide (TPR) repeat protein
LSQLAEKYQQALALHRQGQVERARKVCREILEAQPAHADALHLLGWLALQTRDPRTAADLIGKAIEIDPHNAIAHFNRGTALHGLKQWEAALHSYDRAIALKSDYAKAHCNRGVVLQQLKRLDEAVCSHDRAIAVRRDFPEAYLNRGNALRELGDLSAALASYDHAVALKPDYAQAHSNRGTVQRELGQWRQALECFAQAIRITPGYVDAHVNRGNVLRDLKESDAALASFERALTLNQACAEAHSGRGNVLKDVRQWDAALASYDRAIAVAPAFAEGHSNRGVLLHQLNRFDAALQSYDRALEIEPNYAEARFNRSVTLLVLGDFSRGWREYEWRWKNKGGTVIRERRDFVVPLWLGEAPLAGRTILLHGEQGYGDAIQFCRYARLVAELGASVILEVNRPLAGLLADIEGVSHVVVRGSELPPVDFHCPLMSLPLAFNTTLSNIPAAGAYLRANSSDVMRWRTKLGERTGTRVGLAWRGNPNNANDANRNIPLRELTRHLPSTFEWISLQKDTTATDLETLGNNAHIRDFSGDLKDFADTAALCACLDVVITVDTSVAHLSAALGKPTWILLPFNADWRWLCNRDDSPWYPSATLYRQRASGDWNDVLERVMADLQARH